MKTPTVRNEPARRPFSAGLPTCESTPRTKRINGQSTFSEPGASPIRQPILHSAFCTLRSQNPHGTAVFCTVPRNEFFYFRSGSSRNSNSVLPLPFGIWKFSISPLRVASAKNVDFSLASTCNFQLLPLEVAPDSRTRDGIARLSALLHRFLAQSLHPKNHRLDA